MSLIPNPLSTVLEQVLAFQNGRHNAIASNIANANTPGYRSFDLVLSGYGAGSAGNATTLEAIGARLVRSDSPPRLDGNNVSLEDEFVKLMQNRMRYQATFELMDRWGALMPIAREIR